MLKKLIIAMLMVYNAIAELNITYEGDCMGRDIPGQYYSIISSIDRKAIIKNQRLYAVVRVENQDEKRWFISSLKFKMTPTEKRADNAFYDKYQIHDYKTETCHRVRPGESYRIFVPIPDSVRNCDGKILADLLYGETEHKEREIIIPYNQRKQVSYGIAEYAGLETELRPTKKNQFILKLRNSGTTPTYFMYDRLTGTPVAVVCSNKGRNKREHGLFGPFLFGREHTVRAILFPGDRLVSPPNDIFCRESEWERDGMVKFPVPYDDLIIIAQDYYMFDTSHESSFFQHVESD